MANYIVSYDLNGPNPSHKQMDDHLAKIGAARARILETVWYVGSTLSRDDLMNHVRSILSLNDQVIVVEALEATFRKLLVTDDSFKNAWNANR
jgi:hypothetical protein